MLHEHCSLWHHVIYNCVISFIIMEWISRFGLLHTSAPWLWFACERDILTAETCGTSRTRMLCFFIIRVRINKGNKKTHRIRSRSRIRSTLGRLLSPGSQQFLALICLKHDLKYKDIIEFSRVSLSTVKFVKWGLQHPIHKELSGSQVFGPN